MVYCCVPFCKSLGAKGRREGFHEFPSDKVIRGLWLKAIARANFTINGNSRSSVVCSLHFQDDDYVPGLKIRKLKKGVVPSIFPGYPQYKVPEVILESRKRTACEVTMPRAVNETFKCDICRRECVGLTELRSHELIHYGVKPFVCQVCFRAFTEEAAMLEHAQTHCDEEQVVCEVCSQSFRSQCLLVRHRKYAHSGRGNRKRAVENLSRCGYCSMFFLSVTELMVHMMEHVENGDELICDNPNEKNIQTEPL